jgi:hypothetical protein
LKESSTATREELLLFVIKRSTPDAGAQHPAAAAKVQMFKNSIAIEKPAAAGFCVSGTSTVHFLQQNFFDQELHSSAFLIDGGLSLFGCQHLMQVLPGTLAAAGDGLRQLAEDADGQSGTVTGDELHDLVAALSVAPRLVE